MADPEILPSPQPPAEPAAPPPAAPKYTILRGPNGIRAGWRALIFLAIVGGCVLVFIGILRLVLRGAGSTGISQLTPGGTAVSEGVLFLFPTIAALIMGGIEHRRYGQYGLPVSSAFRKNFWIGIFAGFAAISVCLCAMFALRGFRITGLAIHGNTIVWATAAWSGAFVLVGLAEEFSFRGYLQFTLTTGMGFWPSAILLSALFGLVHGLNPGETIPGLLSVVCFALLFCLFLRRTGNLWLAVGFHAGWDWGQTFFYGVPDSGLAPYHNLLNSAFEGPHWLTGGSVGPEASVFTPIVLGIVAILFARIYREDRYQAT